MLPAGADGEGNCPFEGACEAKAALAAGVGIEGKDARALESWPGGSRPAWLKVCLTFLVVSTPCRGRRARYGKLRFPSCAPFHPPGTPLPLALASTLRDPASASPFAVSSESRPSSFGMDVGTRLGLQGRQEVLRPKLPG